MKTATAQASQFVDHASKYTSLADRVNVARSALDAVQSLTLQGQVGSTLNLVQCDDMACLLGLILDVLADDKNTLQ